MLGRRRKVAAGIGIACFFYILGAWMLALKSGSSGLASSSPPPLATHDLRRWSGGNAVGQSRAVEDHLTIVVLANKRLGPLVRLLISLREADYAQDSGITLHIRLEANQPSELVDFVVNYHWPHGEKVVHSRIVQGGLIAAVVEGWSDKNSRWKVRVVEEDGSNGKLLELKEKNLAPRTGGRNRKLKKAITGTASSQPGLRVLLDLVEPIED